MEIPSYREWLEMLPRKEREICERRNMLRGMYEKYVDYLKEQNEEARNLRDKYKRN